MLIRHIGHAEFSIITESGTRIVTDPYDASCGYPIKKIPADIALVSHHHHDHDAVENLEGEPAVIETAGSHEPAPGVRITAVRGLHDDEGGKKRGETLLFLMETEGLRVVHLGDLGDDLTAEQERVLRQPDVLMIPVGGFYTIDGKKAAEIAKRLEARIILPMHYKTEYNADWPIAGPEAFLAAFEEKEICRGAEALRVTKEDLACHPRVFLL